MTALTTLATLKAELGITVSTYDTRLSGLIAQVSAAIETFCDRSFARRTVTDVFLQPKRTLYLSAWPVTSVTSVTESGTVLTTDDYVIDTDQGIIVPPVDGVGFGSPCGYNRYWPNLTVIYVAGYLLPADVGANLPADIERACLDLATRYYHGGSRDPALRSETVPGVIEQSWSVIDRMETVGGIPLDVAHTLGFYRRAYL